jgi:hypothetical protein
MSEKKHSRRTKKQSAGKARKRAVLRKIVTPFHELPHHHQKRIFRAVNTMLKEHGVAPVSALHMDAADDDDGCRNCPPDADCKMVCREENGTIVCKPVCVPF